MSIKITPAVSAAHKALLRGCANCCNLVTTNGEGMLECSLKDESAPWMEPPTPCSLPKLWKNVMTGSINPTDITDELVENQRPKRHPDGHWLELDGVQPAPEVTTSEFVIPESIPESTPPEAPEHENPIE